MNLKRQLKSSGKDLETGRHLQRSRMQRKYFKTMLPVDYYYFNQVNEGCVVKKR